MSIISSNSADRFSLLKEEIYKRGYRKVSDGRWSCPKSRGFESGYLEESHDSNSPHFYTTIEMWYIRRTVVVNRIETLDALEEYWFFGENYPMSPENFKKYWILEEKILKLSHEYNQK